MIATVSIADLGSGGTLRTLVRRPDLREMPGLGWADVCALVPLATTRPPSLRRVALVAFWDDEESAERFLRTHRSRELFGTGFHATLRPLRAFGTWPGLPADVPGARAVPHDGPVVVLTLGRLRTSQTLRFIRASRPAERAAATAPGLIWGTAAARPPFVATISMWNDSDATLAYAYAREHPQHSDAIAAQRRKDFHRQSAFVRFAPVHVEGALDGTNPLPASALTRAP